MSVVSGWFHYCSTLLERVCLQYKVGVDIAGPHILGFEVRTFHAGATGTMVETVLHMLEA